MSTQHQVTVLYNNEGAVAGVISYVAARRGAFHVSIGKSQFRNHRAPGVTTRIDRI